jgi:heptaprenyl diphosphate synthase
MTIPSWTDAVLAERIQDRLSGIEQRLRDAVSQADPILDEAARHLVNAGGKRLRPVLTMLTAHLGDPDRPEVFEAAVATELIHLATLYHDDVMDSAPMRRGAPSVHEVWGNTVAILIGDVLLARASGLVAALGPKAVQIQAETFERLCLGQLRETLGPRPDDDPVDHYIQVLSDKTGSLIATSARYGAMFGGCDDDIVAMVTGYGEKAGVAFQLSDDVIDLVSDPAVTGKTPGTDLREQVATMPVLLLRDLVARGQGSAEDVETVAMLDSGLTEDGDLDLVVQRLRTHPVVEQTRELAREWAGAAKAEIEGLPDGPVHTALIKFADVLVERSA